MDRERAMDRDREAGIAVFPFTAMGCAAEIRISGARRPHSQRAARRAIAEIRRIEGRLSRYRPDSLVARINAAAGRAGAVIAVDPETAGLLDYAATCWRESGGRFDITSGVLRQAWNFRSGRIPAPETVQALLPRIGWEKVFWQPPQIHLPQTGMEIDLGGIGKEYAADRAAACCLAEGAGHALINLGGDIRVTGARADGRPWVIGITHPDNPAACVANVALEAGGLASSGDYERCVTVNGRRYSHLLDPRTGWPVNGLRAVSVAAPVCLVAGSLATLAMLAGELEGKALLAAATQPFLWVDSQGHVGGPLADCRLL